MQITLCLLMSNLFERRLNSWQYRLIFFLLLSTIDKTAICDSGAKKFDLSFSTFNISKLFCAVILFEFKSRHNLIIYFFGQKSSSLFIVAQICLHEAALSSPLLSILKVIFLLEYDDNDDI